MTIMKSRQSKFTKANETTAMWRGVPMSPRKLRLVADHVRNLPVEQAMSRLRCSPNKGAKIILKVLESAMANAEHNNNADIDLMRITALHVDGARTMKRLRPRARGRADRILKRTSHVTMELAETREARSGS